ncbi:MAG: DNA repair protein RecO (recombination protein O) [Candidatus Berkelbacteria bacterium Licking1014_7]|uniref:DNA repair protein RecO n=1 Tax=Candidatus Berkelbacteria bacterium Licking1014_7 TaxID=2017147 RepID=A0A554LJN8_9BACT|nr:MAG: DNA repair protein RecO (recombination protein O) [Candidatus Berkelbacteria bacterium Licking1014_7]
MPNIKTKGIVVARRDFSESDRLIWIFTEDFGLVQALARGARKILARLNGHLELANLAKFHFYKGKTFYTIIDAQVINNFSKVKNDLKNASLIYHFLELVKIFLPLGEKHPAVLGHLSDSIEILGRQNHSVAKIFFELQFVSELGFKPEMHECVICQKRLALGKNFFSFLQGGILCSDCSVADKSSFGVSDNCIKLIRWIAIENISTLKKLENIPDNLIQETDRILEGYLEFLAERKLVGQDFVKKVKRLSDG